MKNPEDLTLHNVRSIILSNILTWRKKYYKEYGEIVLALDNTAKFGYWRRDYYDLYKATRAKNREESVFNWGKFFEYFDQVKLELSENFPYKILSVERCEADELIFLELANRPEPVERSLIISADKDLKQCQRLINVRQWSYMTKKFLDEKHPLRYILEHTIRGDSGDGVPNILSPDDVFINPNIRQKPIKTVDIERWVNMQIPDIINEAAQLLVKKSKSTTLNYTFDEALKFVSDNFKRNSKMVDLNKTPEEYVKKLIESPEVTNKAEKANSLYSYFIKHGLFLFVHDIDDFVNSGEKIKLTFKEVMARRKLRNNV